MDSKIEVRACPFCGSDEILCENDKIICDRCGCPGPDPSPLSTALEVWNDRTNDTEINRLKLALKLANEMLVMFESNPVTENLADVARKLTEEKERLEKIQSSCESEAKKLG